MLCELSTHNSDFTGTLMLREISTQSIVTLPEPKCYSEISSYNSDFT